VDELDSGGLYVLTTQSPPSPGEHAFARIHTNDLGPGKSAAALHQASPVAFPQQKNVPNRGNVIQEGGAATLQLLSRQEEFHPSVMRRQRIKAHGKDGFLTQRAASTTIGRPLPHLLRRQAHQKDRR